MTFSNDLKKAADKFKKKSDARLRRIALASYQKINEQSPVDMGTFRANWLVSFNTLDRKFNEGLTSGDVQVAINNASAMIGKATVGTSVFICNSVPYAIALEHGHSQQALGGVVSPSTELIRNSISAGRL